MRKIPVRQIQNAPLMPGSTGRFLIRELQQLLNGKDMRQDPHKHDFYYILALQKGGGMHSIDFMEYTVRPGSLFLLRPGQLHSLELHAKSTGFILEFDEAFYPARQRIGASRWVKAISRNQCRMRTPGFQSLYNRLSYIYTESRQRLEGYTEAIRAELDLFFLDYIRQSRQPSRSPAADKAYTEDRFEELARLIESNITRLRSVKDYAALMHLSPYQLNALAKSARGKTVSALIQEQIILEAKRNLLAGSAQVKEIAAALGFEDNAYFIRFFRKRTGLSPEAFRRTFK